MCFSHRVVNYNVTTSNLSISKLTVPNGGKPVITGLSLFFTPKADCQEI